MPVSVRPREAPGTVGWRELRAMDGAAAFDFYATLCGLPRAQRRARADELLEQVGLAHAANARVRTYSFPQNRLTDHRVNENFPLEKIIAGEMQPLIDALQAHDRAEKLAALAKG